MKYVHMRLLFTKHISCLLTLSVCLIGCRILQYGQMSMSSEASQGDLRVTKAYVEAVGDQGLLNLLTDDTVFFVGGYPSSFKVSTWWKAFV